MNLNSRLERAEDAASWERFLTAVQATRDALGGLNLERRTEARRVLGEALGLDGLHITVEYVDMLADAAGKDLE